jgi:hypothetical protein
MVWLAHGMVLMVDVWLAHGMIYGMVWCCMYMVDGMVDACFGIGCGAWLMHGLVQVLVHG